MDNQELQQGAVVAPISQSSLAAATASIVPMHSSLDTMNRSAIIPLSNTQQVISLRLSNTNFLYWRMQMKPFLLGQGVYSFVDGTSPCPPSHLISTTTSLPSVNPSYLLWTQQDHLIMSALLSSLSTEVLHLVVDCKTSQEIWTTLETALASPSNSRIMQLHGAFQELRQHDDSASTYLQKAKALFDELAAAGRPISMAEFNLYVFRGLHSDFKDLVTSLSTKADPISYTDLHSHLLTHEFLHKASLHLAVTAPLLPTPSQQPSAFFGQRQFGSSTGRRGRFRGGWRQSNRSYNRGNHGYSSDSANNSYGYGSGPKFGQQQNRFSSGSGQQFGQQGNRLGGYNRTAKCQLCYDYGHTAQQCSQLATHNLQANANLAFNNAPITAPVTWFPDTGANHHVTPDLASMTSSEPYCGNDHLHVGDGKGLTISNIAHSKIRSPKRTFTLSNIYMCLTLKNLYFLFKSFVLRIMCFLNFIHFYFMLRTS